MKKAKAFRPSFALCHWNRQTLNFNSKKNIFYSRITILLALAILVTAPPSNHPSTADSRAAASPKWRFRRSVADPTTLSSEALEQLVKRHFYEQQKTRWWFKNRFRSVGSCVASTIFFDQASIYTDQQVQISFYLWLKHCLGMWQWPTHFKNLA